MTKPIKKIASARWISEHGGLVELCRDWKFADLPPLFSTLDKRPLSELQRASPLLFAEKSGYFVEGELVTFVIFPDHYPNIELENRVLYVVGDFNDWGNAECENRWILQPIEADGQRRLELKAPQKSCYDRKWSQFKFVTDDGQWLEAPADAPNAGYDRRGHRNFRIHPHQTGRHIFTFTRSQLEGFDGGGGVLWKEGDYEEVAGLVQGDYFLKAGTDLALGAIVEKNRTVFRLFAPRATGATVSIFKDLQNTNSKEVLEMERVDATTWEAVFTLNLHGYYYHFNLEDSHNQKHTGIVPGHDILDPYAIVAVGPGGPGIVWDRFLIDKPAKNFVPPARVDLVIMEAHVRDLTARAPIDLDERERLGFSGLRKWIESEEFYATSLGVNALELQPVQQYDVGEAAFYQWGYMPVNYFSPHAGYASFPNRGSQIRDFQDLVTACHSRGLAVILDVVYNHTGEPNHLGRIDKRYFFELDNKGEFFNWSGTGNTLRGNSPMARRLIIESLIHLMEIYDVDGFRFDLAELIGVETLREIEKALKKVRPSVILIAEPWSFRGHIAKNLKATGYSSWNDGFRNFMRQYLMGHGDLEGIQFYLAGSPGHLTSFPAQTINYVESHDDRCWLDNITEYPGHNGSDPTFLDRRRTHLMVAILMSSLGIPMISAGQDMLRSKGGVHNTYLRGDLNALDYDRMLRFSGTHEYFRNWIRFRLSAKGRAFRLSSHPGKEYLRFFDTAGSSALAVLYNADGSVVLERILFAVNPHNEEVALKLNDIALKEWTQVADHERFAETGLDAALLRCEGKILHLPAMSCGLWVE